MLIYKITIVLFLASVLSGCKDKEHTGMVEVIKINPYEVKDEINLSEIADSVIYIKLQTDSNCVMGRIHDIFIREKYIYALDVSQHIIFVFDKHGKLISKLDKRGKGPDEYLRLGPTFIDDNEELIEFINYSGKNPNITKYSNISFNLLDNKTQMPGISANSCRREGDTYYFATQQIENIVNGI